MPSSSTLPLALGTILPRWRIIGEAEQAAFSSRGRM